MSPCCEHLWHKLSRKKPMRSNPEDTGLQRCLGVIDVAMLGVSHMVGSGLFVITGTVLGTQAGPAGFISYILAAAVTSLTAMCYAELGARIPQSGSSYSFTYTAIGEAWAFLVGWTIILENFLGCAATVRAFTGAVDVVSGGAVLNWTVEHITPIYLNGNVHYPYPLAFILCFFVTIFVMAGVKWHVSLNNVFATLNVSCIIVIIVIGLTKADISNWTSQSGGFMPHGFSGVLTGAGTCVFAYCGIENISTAGEEAIDPAKKIPKATALAMGIVTILYTLASLTLSLMVPYYTIDEEAPFPSAFHQLGMGWATYLVGVGVAIALSTSVIGALFAFSRSVYAMSNDGLLFSWLSYVHPRTQTPIFAALLSGLSVGVISTLVELETLVETCAAGTLVAYCMVAVCVIMLRYRPESENQQNLANQDSPASDQEQLLSSKPGILRPKIKSVSAFSKFESSICLSSTIGLMLFCVCVLALSVTMVIVFYIWWSFLMLTITLITAVVVFGILMMYAPQPSLDIFQVPLVPFVPLLSIFLNLILMMQLRTVTWFRLACWMAIGLLIYLVYGISNSKLNKPLSEREIKDTEMTE